MKKILSAMLTLILLLSCLTVPCLAGANDSARVEIEYSTQT